MSAEVSFDLVMDDNMPFVEGCYRIMEKDWCVFTILKSKSGRRKIGINKDAVWTSGVKGLSIVVDDNTKLDRGMSLSILSEALDVSDWKEVSGPDSMAIR